MRYPLGEHSSSLCIPQAQYIFLHQCILRFLQKSALIQKESIYENVPNFVYENVAAIRAHESEVSATGC